MSENKQIKKRVLIVDDEPKVLTFVNMKLKLCGYDVITAASGREALDLVRSDNPDIMVLDIVMPEMDGFEVLKNLRSFTKMPVIVFSARSTNSDQVFKLGANDFIAKPFDPDDLVRRIKRLMPNGNGHCQQ